MKNFLSGTAVVFSLEMRQRVRGTAWYVLLGVFAMLVLIVTALTTIAINGFGDQGLGNVVFSVIIYFVLLLGTLVAPALSGNAINGDREAGTLATTQVTLISTWQLVIGKFLAAWLTALAFLGVAVPFLVFSSAIGGLDGPTILISILVLAAQLGVIAAIGVGLSGLISRPLFSIVATYLVVAALSIGTLIAFVLGGLSVQTQVTSTYSYGSDYDETTGYATACLEPEVSVYPAPRFDLFWGFLAANPYVLLADAVPISLDENGNPDDLFGSIKWGIHYSQIPPETEVVYDECDGKGGEYTQGPSAEKVFASTAPSWFVGLAINLALGAAALIGAWSRTRTPAGRLSKGSRIA